MIKISWVNVKTGLQCYQIVDMHRYLCAACPKTKKERTELRSCLLQPRDCVVFADLVMDWMRRIPRVVPIV